MVVIVSVSKLHNGRIQVAVAKPQHNSKPVQSYVSEKEVREILLALGVAPQQPRGSKRMLAVCRAGSKVTEVLAQYAGLSHRPSMTNSGHFTTYHL